MKLRYHFIIIVAVFVVIVVPLFYMLYCWGYIPNRDWNANANSTMCLVEDTLVIGAVCTTNSRVKKISLRRSPPMSQCYDGVVSIKLMNVTKDFDVIYGSFEQVNQTLETEYRKGSLVECLVQRTNASDFELHLKETTTPLVLSFVLPGVVVVALSIWGVCAICSKKENYFNIEYT
jgi:hypothetical protein